MSANLSTLFIVIINAGQEIVPLKKEIKNNNISLLPTSDELNKIIELCESKDFKVKFYFVDEKHAYPTNEDKKTFDSFNSFDICNICTRKYTFMFNSSSSTINEMIFNNIFNTELDWVALSETEEPVLYISFGLKQKFYEDKDLIIEQQSSYDLARNVHTQTYENKYFISLPKKRTSIIKYVSNIFEEKMELMYNPYSGDVIPEKIEVIPKEVNRVINLGFDNLNWFLKAGFHERKILQNIDGWAMNVNNDWISGLIDTYKIKPQCIDQDPQFRMNESSQFRYIITLATISVLSNFVLNNGLIELKDVKNWYDITMWSSLKDIFNSQINE